MVGLTWRHRAYLMGCHLNLAHAGVPNRPLLPNSSVEVHLFWKMELWAGAWGPQPAAQTFPLAGKDIWLNVL